MNLADHLLRLAMGIVEACRTIRVSGYPIGVSGYHTGCRDISFLNKLSGVQFNGPVLSLLHSPVSPIIGVWGGYKALHPKQPLMLLGMLLLLFPLPHIVLCSTPLAFPCVTFSPL
jgi:hypothetical protein